MQAKDIEGASPNCVKFKTKRSGLDPLNPRYNLPQVEFRPITPPKYIRDAMEINDIEGARPRKHKIIQYETRDIMKIDDIHGTHANLRHKPRARSPGFDSFDYSDITKNKFVSSRITNPLNPTYMVRVENEELIEIGEVAGSKPTTLPPQKKDPNLQPSSSLITSDIAGATAGTKNMGVFGTSHSRT